MTAVIGHDPKIHIPDEPMKVLMLASSYPRDSNDTASIFLRHLAHHLRDRGVAVHVLVPADREAGTTIESGIVIHRFAYLPRRWRKLAYGSGILPNLKRRPLLWLQVPFFLASMAVSLYRTIRRERPAVVHAHWIIPQGTVAVLLKQLCRTTVLTTAHGGDAFALNNWLVSRLKHYTITRSNAWTANTPTTARAAIGAAENCPPTPRIIPMGVNVNQFSSGDRRRLRSGTKDENIVAFVGRLVRKKGVDDLFTAFALLPAQLRARTRLWIVGDGELFEPLRARSNHLGISEQVTFWGRIPNDQLPDFLAAADLFVGPSVRDTSGDTEGQGVVFLEAFSAGVCVIAARTGGITDVIEDGITGVLVEPKQPRQLADAITELLHDSARRAELARNARNLVTNRYSWTIVAASFEELYRELARDTGNPDQTIG